MFSTKQDNAFFQVEAAGFPLGDLTKNVKSISITEELRKACEGQITFRDVAKSQLGIITAKLIPGTIIKVKWGYNASIPNIFRPPGDVFGTTQREISAVIERGSGGGDESGELTYNVNFIGVNARGDRKTKSFSTGTRGSVIREVLSGMGATFQQVNFQSMNQAVTPQNPLRQFGSDHQFLVDLSRQWGAIYRTAETPRGNYACFVDFSKVGSIDLPKKITYATGSQRTFNYKTDAPNVISYTWSENAGQGGTGDAVTILVDSTGNRVFSRRKMPGEKVLTYRLSADAIRREMESKPNFQDKLDLTSWILAQTDFNEVKRFFTAVEDQTAPQGAGFEVKLSLYGDPMLTPPLPVSFGANFPAALKDEGIKFYLRSVTHTLGENYRTDADVADTFALGGAFGGL